MSGDQFFCSGASVPNFEVLNEPTHVCALPPAGAYPIGTDVMCEAPRLGGLFADGRCGRRYTRARKFWRRTPYWADYDYGW